MSILSLILFNFYSAFSQYDIEFLDSAKNVFGLFAEEFLFELRFWLVYSNPFMNTFMAFLGNATLLFIKKSTKFEKMQYWQVRESSEREACAVN